MKPKRTPFSRNVRNRNVKSTDIIAALKSHQLDTFQGAGALSVIRQSHVDHVLRHLAQGASFMKQERFFNFLALHLAAALCADYVLIGEVAADDSRKIATLGFVARGKMRTKITYDFSRGPCRQLLRQKNLYFSFRPAKNISAQRLSWEIWR